MYPPLDFKIAVTRGACSGKVSPVKPVENWPISRKVPSIAPRDSVEAGPLHEQGDPIGPRCAKLHSRLGNMMARGAAGVFFS